MAIKRVKRKVNGIYRWVFIFDAYISDRRRRTPRGKYFLTREDCDNALSALKTDALRKEYGIGEPDKPSVTISILANKWIEMLTVNNRSKAYIRRGERLMEAFALNTNDKLVKEVSLSDLQDFAIYLSKQELREGTIKEYLTMLHVGLNAATELFSELHSWKPPRKPKLGLAESHRQRVITADEEKRIIAAYLTKRNREHPQYHAAREQGARIFWFALRTALRVGEIIGLRRSSIIFEPSPKMPFGYILIMEQRAGARTKTGKVRKIPMTPSVKEMLETQLASHSSEYLFPSLRNSTKPVAQFYTGFRAACRIAKVGYGRDVSGGVVFHDTRHTAITRMLEQGKPLHIVAAIAGHANNVMTLRYAHAADDATFSAVMSLDDSNFRVHEKTEEAGDGRKATESSGEGE